MWDNPYPFDFLGDRETFEKNPTKRAQYRFKAKERTYMATLETFAFRVSAIKYCDRQKLKSKTAYQEIYNDGDGFRVITTNLFIMLDHWRRNPNISFCFYAVPRAGGIQKFEQRGVSKKKKKVLARRHEKTRFNIYKYAMVNLFPYEHFLHFRDPTSNIYLLLNKRDPDREGVKTAIKQYLNDHHDILFEPVRQYDYEKNIVKRTIERILQVLPGLPTKE